MTTLKNDQLKEKLKQKYIELRKSATGSHYSRKEFDFEAEKESHSQLAVDLAKTLEKEIGNLKNKKLLELGSGFGDFAVELAKHVKEVRGIEPENKYYEVSELKKEYYRSKNVEFYNSSAENIPFKDNEFDIVISKTVLEHVSDLERVISEMARVTKTNGIVYTEAPNYFWIKEGHYNVFMLPLMPRFLFKTYLKLLDKDPNFLDGLNYITPGKIIRLFNKYGFKTENLYLRKLRKILIEKEFEQVSTGNKSYLRVIKILYSLRLNGLVYWFFSKFNFYPTILLLSKKIK